MKKLSHIDLEAQKSEGYGSDRTEREVKEETNQDTILQMILRHYE